MLKYNRMKKIGRVCSVYLHTNRKSGENSVGRSCEMFTRPTKTSCTLRRSGEISVYLALKSHAETNEAEVRKKYPFKREDNNNTRVLTNLLLNSNKYRLPFTEKCENSCYIGNVFYNALHIEISP